MTRALLGLLLLASPALAQAPAELEKAAANARRDGDFVTARQHAEAAVTAWESDPEATAHRLAIAKASLQSLAVIAALDSAAWDSLHVAERLSSDVYRHYRSGAHEASAAAAQRQLSLRRAVLPRPHFDLTVSLSWLSLALRNLGDFAGAEEASRDALQQFLELYGREHVHTATGVNALADLLRQRGRLVEAEVLLREALLVRTRLFGDDHFVLAGTHNNLANLLGAQGEYAEAAGHFQSAIELVRAHRGPRHRLVATGLRNLAVVLHAQGDLDAAEGALRESMDIAAENENPASRARAQRWLAQVLFDRGEMAASEANYREAIERFTESDDGGADWMASARTGLGQVLARGGSDAAAASQYQLALDSLQDMFGPNHPSTVETQIELARLHWSQGASAKALALLDDAVAGYEVARSQSATDWKRATVRIESPYLLQAAVLIDLGQAEAAWQASDRARARTLSELIDKGGLRAPVDAEAEEDLRLRLSASEAEVSQLRETKAPVDEIAAAVERRRSVQLEWSQWQRQQLSARQTQVEQAAELAAVQSQLAPDEALVSWIRVTNARGEPRHWGVVIRNDGMQWVALAAPSSQLPELSQHLSGVHATAFGLRIDAEFEMLASGVAAEWFAPLRPHLSDVTRVSVVPGESLTGIPLESLQSADGRFLGEEFVIHYVPSAAIFLREADRPRPEASAFLLGDPTFGPGYDPLPHTRDEIAAVATHFDHSLTLLGVDASEAAMWDLIRADALAEVDVLHLATHAIPDAEHPERSALILARPDADAFSAVVAAQPTFDGRITVAEILASWRLDCDLVTLSACETGLGRRVAGEGYMGLAHAFFYAGSRSLLVSLWPVDDEATSLLMARFYENRREASLSKSAALQDAKRWLASYTDDAGRQPFAHPHYWAAFVLVGEG